MGTIILIDSPTHPLSLPQDLSLTAKLIRYPVDPWEDALTPWPAPALFAGEPPFGGQAAATLASLEQALPDQGPVALCGYSLGGLFALWALMSCPRFCAATSLSGSLWYPGWTDWLAAHPRDLTGYGAFLGLGSKEARGPRPLMRTVDSATEKTHQLLAGYGAKTAFRSFAGGHTHHMEERLGWGLRQLDRFLTTVHETPHTRPAHS